MAEKINIPEPHSELPASIRKKWKAAYADAFTEAQNDFPDDVIQQKQSALREANKTLRVPDPKSYDEAMALEDWQVVHRRPSSDGKTLKVVTRHGEKFNFPIPVKKQEPGNNGTQTAPASGA